MNYAIVFLFGLLTGLLFFWRLLKYAQNKNEFFTGIFAGLIVESVIGRKDSGGRRSVDLVFRVSDGERVNVATIRCDERCILLPAAEDLADMFQAAQKLEDTQS